MWSAQAVGLTLDNFKFSPYDNATEQPSQVKKLGKYLQNTQLIVV